MARIFIAALLAAGSTVLLIASLMTSDAGSGQVLSAIALFVIAGLNLLGSVYAEKRRRAMSEEQEAVAVPVRRRRETPPEPDALEEPVEATSKLLSTLEALAEHQERVIGARSEVDLILLSPGRNKIAVIKEIREHTGSGLGEAKRLADDAGKAPVLVASGMPVERARLAADAIIKAGGKALLR
jgi:ribosomal protein L7/L12